MLKIKYLNNKVNFFRKLSFGSDSFYICDTEVTNALWKSVTGSLPYDTVNAVQSQSVSKLLEEPVSCISWNDVKISFFSKLKQKTGLTFRLPTEAEWEYAASGGQFGSNLIFSGSNNIDEVAWYRDNSGNVKQNVKQLLPNELGLYDMSGNVSEWCNDWYKEYYGEWYGSSPTNFITVYNPIGPDSGTLRVIRGGNYMSSVFWGISECGVKERGSVLPACYETVWAGTSDERIVYRCETVGFRFVLALK